MKSIFDQCGYLSNDNRASGGLHEEDDLLGCKHCQALVKKSEWKLEGGFCRACDSPLCATCAPRAQQFGCEVFARTVETVLNEQHRRQQYAKILGV